MCDYHFNKEEITTLSHTGIIPGDIPKDTNNRGFMKWEVWFATVDKFR